MEKLNNEAHLGSKTLHLWSCQGQTHITWPGLPGPKHPGPLWTSKDKTCMMCFLYSIVVLVRLKTEIPQQDNAQYSQQCKTRIRPWRETHTVTLYKSFIWEQIQQIPIILPTLSEEQPQEGHLKKETNNSLFFSKTLALILISCLITAATTNNNFSLSKAVGCVRARTCVCVSLLFPPLKCLT